MGIHHSGTCLAELVAVSGQQCLPHAVQVQTSIMVACEGYCAGEGICSHQSPLMYSALTALVLQAHSKSDFFNRETERSLLLKQLQESPTGMLVIVGPRSSGKSRLLEEVLIEKDMYKALVTFIDGRGQKFTDAGIMAAALRDQGARQLSAVRHNLEHKFKTMGRAAWAEEGATLPILSMIESHLNNKDCSINDVMKAYGNLLSLSSSTSISTTRPWPVICIDEANVLMGWYKGGAAMEDDLDALLRFLVKVRAPLYC